MVREAERRDGVRNMFARLAPRYDMGNRVLSLGQDVRWRRYAARLAQADGPGLVLDVATGTGDLGLAFARRGSRVVALDFCTEMAGLALDKARRDGARKRIEFLLGDALNLPFPRDMFDAVTIGFGIRNIPELLRCLSELKRVLRPGGRLVTLELFKPVGGVAAAVHGFYLDHVVPVIGSWLSGQRDAYDYLSSSIRRFASTGEFTSILEEAGLSQVEVFRLGAGAAAVHLAIKK